MCLSFISDLQVVILNKNHYMNQVELLKSFRNIYKLIKVKYDQKKKEDDEFDFSSSLSEDNIDYMMKLIDEEESISELEEDTLESESDDAYADITKDDFSNYLKVFSKNVKTIFLINDSALHEYQEIDKELIKNQFFQNLKSQVEGESAIHYINIKEPDSYESFLKGINDMLLNECSKFSEVTANFENISLFKMNPTYIRIRIYGSQWKDELKNMVNMRNLEIISNSSKEENAFHNVSKLSNELAQITPSIDTDFSNECNLILYPLESIGIKKNRSLYSLELQKSAESELECLKKRITGNVFLSEEEIDLFTKTHFNFLKTEFFDIIKISCEEKIHNIIYQENYDILENQMKADKEKINNIFKSFIEKNKIRKNIKEQDVKKKIQEGANYCMKETENIREIKIVIQTKKDLKSEMKQDF